MSQQRQQQRGTAAADGNSAESLIVGNNNNSCVSSTSLSSSTSHGNGGGDRKPDDRDADAELVLSVVFLGAKHKKKLFEKLLESAEHYERHIRYRDTFYLYYRFNDTITANNDDDALTMDKQCAVNRKSNAPPPPLPSSVVVELRDPGLEHTGAREMAIRKADAVILTYAAHDAVTFHQLASLADDFQARASRDGRLYPPTLLMCNEDAAADDSGGEAESDADDETDDDCSSETYTRTIATLTAEEPSESDAKPSKSVTPEDGYASDEQSGIVPELGNSFVRRRRSRRRHRNQPASIDDEAVTYRSSTNDKATAVAVTVKQGEHMAQLFGAECRHFSASFARFDAARPMVRRLIEQVMATRQTTRRGGKKNDHYHVADLVDATATRKKPINGQRSPPKLSSLRLTGRRRRASNLAATADDASGVTSPPHPPSTSSASSSSYTFRILPPLKSINKRFGRRRSTRNNETTRNAFKSSGKHEEINASTAAALATASFATTELIKSDTLGLPPTDGANAIRRAGEPTDESRNVCDLVGKVTRQTLTIRVTAENMTGGLYHPHQTLHQQHSNPPPYRDHNQLCVAEVSHPQRSRSANALLPSVMRHRSVSPRFSTKAADNDADDITQRCGRTFTPRGHVTLAASPPLLMLSAPPERALVRVRSAQRLMSDNNAVISPPRRPRSSCSAHRTLSGHNDNSYAQETLSPTPDRRVHSTTPAAPPPARGNDSPERKSADKAHWFKRLSNHAATAPHHKDNNATTVADYADGVSTASSVCVIS